MLDCAVLYKVKIKCRHCLGLSDIYYTFHYIPFHLHIHMLICTHQPHGRPLGVSKHCVSVPLELFSTFVGNFLPAVFCAIVLY